MGSSGTSVVFQSASLSLQSSNPPIFQSSNHKTKCTSAIEIRNIDSVSISNYWARNSTEMSLPLVRFIHSRFCFVVIYSFFFYCFCWLGLLIRFNLFGHQQNIGFDMFRLYFFFFFFLFICLFTRLRPCFLLLRDYIRKT